MDERVVIEDERVEVSEASHLRGQRVCMCVQHTAKLHVPKIG